MTRSLIPLLITFVLFGCEEEGIVQLSASGAFEPAALDFGEVSIGTAKPLEVQLQNTGRVALTLETVSLPQDFSIRGVKGMLEGTTLMPGTELIFEVVFFPSIEGERSDQLVVTAKNAEDIVLDLRGLGSLRRLPELVLDPPSLNFGRVDVNNQGNATFTIRNNGLAPATITGVTLQSTAQPIVAGDSFLLASMLPVSVPEGGSVNFGAVFAPATEGVKTDVMVFAVAEDVPDLNLNVSGEGIISAGDIFCTPSNVNFGPVERGMTSIMQVTCEARGGPARLITARVNGSTQLFNLPNPVPTQDLMPGDTATIDVQFVPEGLPDTVSSELIVDYNGGNGASTVTIPLAGEVVPPPPTATAISVVLEWSDNDTDVDLHMIRPGGRMFDLINNSDCYYANRTPDWGVVNDATDNPFLDDDDIDGFGPETINLEQAAPGAYEVQAHYFSDHRNGPTTATLQVFVAGNLVGTFTRPNFACNQVWHVGTVNWDGTNGTFQPVDTTRMTIQGSCF